MEDITSTLCSKLSNRSATIGVVGLGYVGLPLSLRFSVAGYNVIGFDVDQEKATKLNAGESYISHIKSDRIKQAVDQNFFATTDFSNIAKTDAIIVCVPTPLNPDLSPDLSFVIETTESICPFLKKGQVVSLESTTYPGTTDEELFPRISATGLTVGEHVFLVYSPEREDPGNPNFETKTIPKICGGYTKNCLKVGLALYRGAIDQIVPVSSTRVAEMTKLHENIYRAVNIGMVNEMKIVADRLGINIYEVIEAAKTKPFGFTPFYPGPGLGGHCLPIDPFYLSWKANECGVQTQFIHLAGKVNTAMPNWILGKLKSGLNKSEVELAGALVLIIGIAYKKNIDDMRESPAVAIMELLNAAGASVAYSDPYVPVFPKMRNHSFDIESIAINAEMLSNYDAVIITTDHDCFDYALIEKYARLIIDTRGRYAFSPSDHIISA